VENGLSEAYEQPNLRTNRCEFKCMWIFQQGQVENAETKTEVRKRKYGSEKKSCLSVAWLTNVPCRQRVTVSKRCESQVLIYRTPVSTNTVV